MNKYITLIAVFVLFYAASALAAVNINSASADELTQLSGIGSTKAAAIVAYREEHGNFDSVDSLSNVKGIGSKTVESLRGDVSVSASEMGSGAESGAEDSASM